MPSDQQPSPATATDVLDGTTERPPLSPAAQRALAEAAARRAARDGEEGGEHKHAPKEINGRGGLEPTRYGDWEANGLTSDF